MHQILKYRGSNPPAPARQSGLDWATATAMARDTARGPSGSAQQAPGVAASILEGLDEMLTVNRLGLPAKLNRASWRDAGWH